MWIEGLLSLCSNKEWIWKFRNNNWKNYDRVAGVPEREANRSRFQESGSPGRHQWLQSAFLSGCFRCSAVRSFPCLEVYTDVCASIRYSDSCVMFKYRTGVLIFWMVFSTADIIFLGNRCT